jgi:hypothetical protein
VGDRSVSVVVVIVTVKIIARGSALFVRFLEVELYRVEADDDETRVALVASDSIALFNFGVNKNFFTTLGAN